MQSTQKIVNLGLILIGTAIFLFMTNLVKFVWSIAELPRMSEWIVGPPALVSFGLVAIAGIYTRRHEHWNRFLNEAVTELSKVTWPEQKETVMSTGVTCVLVAICALILFLLDSLWGTIMRGLFAI